MLQINVLVGQWYSNWGDCNSFFILNQELSHKAGVKLHPIHIFFFLDIIDGRDAKIY